MAKRIYTISNKLPKTNGANQIEKGDLVIFDWNDNDTLCFIGKVISLKHNEINETIAKIECPLNSKTYKIRNLQMENRNNAIKKIA